MKCPFNPCRDRPTSIVKLLDARAAGGTLRQSAAAAAVHPATLCRWLLLSPVLAAAMRLAGVSARDRRRRARPYRPWVSCHPSCPECGAKVQVRSCGGSWSVRFWRCTGCPWKSWRPRHPRDCSACGGSREWSRSRRTVLCATCRKRWFANPADLRPIPADQVTRPKAPPVPTAAELLARAVAELSPTAPPPDPDPMWAEYERLIG
jgi:hypothetical protein